MKRSLALSFLALMISFASSAETPDLLLGRIYKSSLGTQMICNVYARKTIKTSVNSGRVSTTLLDRATAYHIPEIISGPSFRSLLKKVTDQMSQFNGPSDGPYIEIKAFFDVQTESLLYRQSSGTVEENLDENAKLLSRFVRDNCEE